MFETLIKISEIALPVFVFLTMLNVGLTQKLKNIFEYLKNIGFSLRMLAANFILAPLLMWGMLKIVPIDPYLTVGLTIFSICAGAPFLIKLTQLSDHDMALGASTMVTLVLATVIIVPLALPRILPQVEINGLLIGWTLIKQLILPMILGWIMVKLRPGFSRLIQPWVAKIGNWTLYILLSTTLVGYFPELKKILGLGAITLGVIFIIISFGIGYLLGGTHKKDHLHDIGALGTAQRNTAASMIIAAENFSEHPQVLVVITITNTLGIALLLVIARFLSRDNNVKILIPSRQMSSLD